MKIGITTGKNNNSTKTLACDSSSTYQFGEVQPVLCMEMEAESSVESFLRSQVRLGVLNVPTFGRMLYNVDARFIPMVDVYRPFEELISQQTFSTGDKTYVPTSVPVISVASLSAFVLSLADCTCYKLNPDRTDEYQLLRGSGDVRNVPLAAQNYTLLANAFYHDNFDVHDNGWHNYLGTRTLFSQYALDEYIPRPGQSPGADTPSLKWVQVSPASADFMYRLNVVDGENEVTLLYCFRLNNDARRLYKILVGCGWQFDLSNQDKISFLPFLAFFKGYFDLYRPKTTADGPFTFDQTPAHRLMEQIVHYNIVDLDSDSYHEISGYVTAFLTDLMVSTYFEDTDFVTSHISKPALSNSSLKPNVSDPNGLSSSLSYGSQGSAGTTAGTQPTLNGNSTSTTQTKFTDTAWNVKLLLRLLPYINKNTVIGGNIQKYLKAHGYGDVLENRDTFSAGATYQLPCRISDIDSVADTFNESTGEGDLLGAYTGKGIGVTPSDSPANFKYYTRVPGFFIMYSTVVPLSRVSQGINPMLFHREKLEFYDSAFDALDFSISRKSLVNGRSEVQVGSYDVQADPQAVGSPASGPFGYIPRYSEYCYLPNILNGGLSLRSNRSTFISYVLDKYYQSYSEYIKPLNNTDFLVDLSVGYNIPVATPQLRNIANPLNGNFSRIFAQAQIVGGFDTRTTDLDWYNYEDDKFVVHNAIDVLYSSGKKKLSESFETEDNGHEMTISKE